MPLGPLLCGFWGLRPGAEEVLLDNDRGLVARHDRAIREVEFNARLRAFANLSSGPTRLI
jgi:hypothetical protein